MQLTGLQLAQAWTDPLVRLCDVECVAFRLCDQVVFRNAESVEQIFTRGMNTCAVFLIILYLNTLERSHVDKSVLT